MASSPDIPAAPPPPAKRPERQEAVTAQDVVLGSEADTGDGTKRGKRALTRPAGAAAPVATGLAV